MRRGGRRGPKRIVLGVYVTFDEPSVLSIARCRGHCVRRKSIYVPGTVEELVWLTAGIPKPIHVDNAQEFHSDAFRTACEDWGIAVEYRPLGRAGSTLFVMGALRGR